MKKLMIAIAVSLLTTAIWAKKPISGNSNSFLKGYEVSSLDENSYQLSYENASAHFTIEVCPGESECCYLLRGDNVEVMYVCNDLGLGLRKMPEKWQQLSTKSYAGLVENKAFCYQSLLTPKRKSTKKALALIACFFPSVIKEEARDVVFQNQSLPKTDGLAQQ